MAGRPFGSLSKKYINPLTQKAVHVYEYRKNINKWNNEIEFREAKAKALKIDEREVEFIKICSMFGLSPIEQSKKLQNDWIAKIKEVVNNG